MYRKAKIVVEMQKKEEDRNRLYLNLIVKFKNRYQVKEARYKIAEIIKARILWKRIEYYKNSHNHSIKTNMKNQ